MPIRSACTTTVRVCELQSQYVGTPRTCHMLQYNTSGSLENSAKTNHSHKVPDLHHGVFCNQQDPQSGWQPSQTGSQLKWRAVFCLGRSIEVTKILWHCGPARQEVLSFRAKSTVRTQGSHEIDLLKKERKKERRKKKMNNWYFG